MGILRTTRATTVLVLVASCAAVSTSALSLSKPAQYESTRKLLRKLESLAHDSKVLGTFFRSEDAHLENLIKALDDSDQEVSLRAQIVLRYLRDPIGIRAIDSWVGRQTGEYATAPIPLRGFTSRRIVGSGGNLARLVLKNAVFLEGDDPKRTRARVIAYTAKKDRALVEITIDAGGWTNECYHVVLVKDDQGWLMDGVYLVLQV